MISTSRALLFAVLVASNLGAVRLAHAAADFRLERVSPREMHLAPGQSGTYVLRIRNVGDESGMAQLGSNPVYHVDDPNYTFKQSGSSACGEFGSEPADGGDRRAVFAAGPIAPGGVLDCAMTISRGSDSRTDRYLWWMVQSDQDGYPTYINPTDAALVGTLTDVSIHTRSFDFYIDDQGFAHSTAVLDVHNAGSVPVFEQRVGFCQDNVGRPFLTDGGGPEGCGDDGYGPMCFNSTGYGFIIPAIEAGTTYSCVIHLRSIEPYDHALGFPIAVELQQYEAGNQHWLIDTDQDNNRTALRLEPDGAFTAPVPSGTRLSLLILALFVTVAAAWRVRRA